MCVYIYSYALFVDSISFAYNVVSDIIMFLYSSGGGDGAAAAMTSHCYLAIFNKGSRHALLDFSSLKRTIHLLFWLAVYEDKV